MDLGRELVACALRTGTLKPFAEGGLTAEYLTAPDDLSRSGILGDEGLAAWRTIQAHWDKHGKTPSVDMFRRSFPAATYDLPDTDYSPAELVELFQQERRKLLTTLAASDLADLLREGRAEDAVALMEHAVKVIRETYASKSIVVAWDSADYDVEGRICRELARGVMTGIDGFDNQDDFMGFQQTWLITYLGRAKAGKTSFLLLSALRAWEEGKRVLFVSFEIAAGISPNEPGIADRLDSIGAGIDMSKYMQGRLGPNDADDLRAFRKDCTADVFKIVQPTGRYTAIDLADDIERYTAGRGVPRRILLHDRPGDGQAGSNWEGHDNLASDIKTLAMNHSIPIILTHQVREKQLTARRARASMTVL